MNCYSKKILYLLVVIFIISLLPISSFARARVIPCADCNGECYLQFTSTEYLNSEPIYIDGVYYRRYYYLDTMLYVCNLNSAHRVTFTVRYYEDKVSGY